MSKTEFDTMSSTGRVVEGAVGGTSVIRPANPSSCTGARLGSVYAEFNVPTLVLRQGGRPDWAIIPGPDISMRIFGLAPLEMPPGCIYRGLDIQPIYGRLRRLSRLSVWFDWCIDWSSGSCLPHKFQRPCRFFKTLVLSGFLSGADRGRG